VNNNLKRKAVALMLNEQQFGRFKSRKPKGAPKPKKPKLPGKSSGGGSAGYKFLPVPKSQEERDLMEAKAQALKAKIAGDAKLS
jgi:pyocin large subunit-like protein